jgi:single-stranded-DNA-specific exonuclease
VTRTSRPDPDQVIRRLIPRLNASGRLGDSAAVWKLLLSDTDGPIDDWMTETEQAHGTTKQLHRQLIAQAEEQVSRLHFRDQVVMVVSGRGWHQGLMGPLASQLAQRYGRPAIAIAMDERHGIGSGRSIPLLDLLEILRGCQDVLLQFGGHAQACGLMLDRKQLEPFRALVNQQARRSLGHEGLTKTRTVDLELPLRAVVSRWVEEVERFIPFGRGNPRPTVVIRGVSVESRSPRTGTISDGVARVSAKGPFSTLTAGGCYDVVAAPAMMRGELVLTVSDVKDSTVPWEPARTSGTRCKREPV